MTDSLTRACIDNSPQFKAINDECWTCSYVSLSSSPDVIVFVIVFVSHRIFENVALCCAKYADSIPVVLFLGFFTGTVMQRWWAVYAAIPGTGKIITLATYYLKRNNPEV